MSDTETGQCINSNLLPDVSESFVLMRNGFKNELIKILKEMIWVEIPEEKLHVYKLLKDIPQIDTIITTNFDRIIEEIYGQRINVIIDEKDIPLISTNKLRLFKIHSDFSKLDSLIITKSDYIKFFKKVNDNLIWIEIKSIMLNKSILFIGYSLDDENIRFLFEQILDNIGGITKESYLVAPNLPEYQILNLRNKNISYIDMKAEDLLPKLSQDIKKNF